MSVLFGITLLALIGMTIYAFVPKGPHWKSKLHLVIQSDDHVDRAKLEQALQGISPQNHLCRWNKNDILAHGSGTPSEDTDHGAADKDGTKPNMHVTEQVSFSSAAALSQFLTDAGF